MTTNTNHMRGSGTARKTGMGVGTVTEAVTGIARKVGRKPNILLIMADQHRYDCIGCNGNSLIKTPNFDRLAAEGVRFSNAFTSIPVCCPARQSALNGRRNESFGALWNYNSPLKTGALAPGEYSWAGDLRKAGYSNGYLGVWDVNPEYSPLQYGYDEYVSLKEYSAFREKAYGKPQFNNGYLGENDSIPVEDSNTHWLAHKAIELIGRYSRAGDSPWHLNLNFSVPHLPCRPAGRFAEMYKPSEMPEWGSFRDEFKDKPYIQLQQIYTWEIEKFTWEDWAPIVARYYGIISQMDDAVGLVLDELERLGIAEETIVVYTSDHGDMCGAHRMIDKHYIMYDDVVRVPYIVRWPGVSDAGRECGSFIYSTLDMAPTMLDLAGIENKDFFHGMSYLPLLNGIKAVSSEHAWRTEVVSSYNGQQFGLYTQRMIRGQKWKYIWNTTDVDELYDLEQDPFELVNRINDTSLADILADLRIRLRDILIKDGDGLMKSPWLLKQLSENRKITGNRFMPN